MLKDDQVLLLLGFFVGVQKLLDHLSYLCNTKLANCPVQGQMK